MVQLTLRDVPDEVHSELRRRAASEDLSMNRLAIKILREGLERGAARELNERRDLSGFVGIWSEDEADACDEVLSEIRQAVPSPQTTCGSPPTHCSTTCVF